MTSFNNRQLFEKLVRLQDELQSSPVPEVRMTYLYTSRSRISERYGQTFKQVRAIEAEGILKGWVDEMDANDQAMAKKGAA
jgi:hypothetical protein